MKQSFDMSKLSIPNERLVIGTAQLGMKYGIANRNGQPDIKISESIIKIAWDSGIREFDTAQAYGESEHVLGYILSSLGINNKVKIASKFHPSLNHLNKYDLLKALEKTLSNLRIPSLYRVVLHKEEFLDLWNKGLSEILSEFVNSGLVEHLGISVYSPDKAINALKTDNISSVQLPSNLFDRRFEKAGVFQLAEENKKQIYVRSVFLQGLLLMDSEDIPANMQFVVAVLKRLEAFSQKRGLSKKRLALGYVKQAYPKAKIVFGVETPEQLRDNLKSWGKALPLGFVEEAHEEFKRINKKILNPALWPA